MTIPAFPWRTREQTRRDEWVTIRLSRRQLADLDAASRFFIERGHHHITRSELARWGIALALAILNGEVDVIALPPSPLPDPQATSEKEPNHHV